MTFIFLGKLKFMRQKRMNVLTLSNEVRKAERVQVTLLKNFETTERKWMDVQHGQFDDSVFYWR